MSNQIMIPDLFSGYISFIDRPTATTKTYINNLKQFAAWLKYTGTTQPIREDILAYRDYLLSDHEAIRLDPTAAKGWSYRRDKSGKKYRIRCSPNTTGQYLRSVGQFFKWTAAEGLYPDIAANVHAPRIRRDYHRKEALRPADVLRIESQIRQQIQQDPGSERERRLLAMFLLAVNCGLRTIEIHRANIRDLEIIGGEAVLYVTGKGRTEPDARKILAPEVHEALEAYLAARQDKKTPGSPLFVATGNRSGGQRLATTTISKMLKAALKAAGYNSDRITAHSLRHTAGTSVQDLTGNLYLTQKYMRHQNPATTEIYLHNDTEAQEAEVARLLYAYYHKGETAASWSIKK